LTYACFTFFVIIFASNMSERVKINKTNIQENGGTIPSTNFTSNRLNDSELLDDEPERKSFKKVFMDLGEALCRKEILMILIYFLLDSII